MKVLMKLPVERHENRLRANFPDAVHLIEQLNFGEHTITLNLRAYADLTSIQTEETADPGIPLPQSVFEYNRSYPIKEILDFKDKNQLTIPVEIQDNPFEVLKYSLLMYIIEKEHAGEVIEVMVV